MYDTEYQITTENKNPEQKNYIIKVYKQKSGLHKKKNKENLSFMMIQLRTKCVIQISTSPRNTCTEQYNTETLQSIHGVKEWVISLL